MQQAHRYPRPLGQHVAARVAGRDVLHPGPHGRRVQQVDDLVQHGYPGVARRGVDQLEDVPQVGHAARPVLAARPVPADHGGDERGPLAGIAVPERLVAGALAEHPQRRARRGADRGQASRQGPVAGQVHRDHRLAPPHRGVHQLEAGAQHVLFGRAAHGHPAGRLGPGQRDPGTRPGRHPEAAPVPGHDAAGPDGPPDRSTPDGDQQTGAGRAHADLVGVQPAQPADDGRLDGTGHDGQRELTRQPAPDPGERAGEVHHVVELIPAGPEVGGHLGRAGREPGGRGPRAHRQRPRHPGDDRDQQPRQPPPGRPGGQREHHGQDDRQLREQHVGQHGDHHAGSQELATAGKPLGDEIPSAPWHLFRLCRDPGRHLDPGLQVRGPVSRQ